MLTEVDIENLSLYKRMLLHPDLAEQEYTQRFSWLREACDNTKNTLLCMAIESTGIGVIPGIGEITLLDNTPKIEKGTIDDEDWVWGPISHHILKYLPKSIKEIVKKRLDECEQRGIYLQNFLYAEQIRGENRCIAYKSFQEWKEKRAQLIAHRRKVALDPILFAHYPIRNDGARLEVIRVIVCRWDSIH